MQPSRIGRTVVEYYNAKLDHYFITASQPDLDALDSGRLPGWQRIGYAFRAFVTRNGSPGSADLQDVCRIYLPPSKGDCHFFSASLAECTASLASHDDFVLETNSAFLARLPDPNTGACPWYHYDEELNLFHWLPQVFRLWNGKVDSNHRYTVDRNVRSDMIAQGWVPEGYGPEGVAFCGGP